MGGRAEYVNEPLARHTTFRIGGPAERLVVPDCRTDLIETVRACFRTRIPWFLLGRGSNTLAGDRGVRGIVIKNTEACLDLDFDGDVVRAGSSVPLQRLVRFCIGNNLGGMEYIYSVPGNVGGAVFMNAGRGIVETGRISDHLVSVEAFDGEGVRTLTKAECEFGYRTSVFHRLRGWTILSATFRFTFQAREVGEARVRERMNLVKEMHDLAYPNAGTVFRRKFVPLPEIIGHRIGEAAFSTKTPGWIINLGGASARNVHDLIAYAVKCHRKRALPAPELEIVLMPESRWGRVLDRVLYRRTFVQQQSSSSDLLLIGDKK